MDEMTAFEQQLAAELGQMAGPGRRIDAMAMVRTASTQNPKWSFQSMFSATKLVVAGGIVALFGGFLLAGVLTLPSEEQTLPVGATAWATTEAHPDDSPVPDLLPGVDLEVEEVRPGVFRVIGDGVRGLTDVWQVAPTAAGEVWVLKQSVVGYGSGGDPVFDEGRVMRLGDPDSQLEARDTVDAKGRGAIERIDVEGEAVVAGVTRGNQTLWFRLDGQRWRPDEGRDDSCEALGTDGSCWWTQARKDGVRLIREDADGSQVRFLASEVGLPEPSQFGPVALGPDGNLVAALRDWSDDQGSLSGLATFDGDEWALQAYDGPEVRPGHISVSASGDVWIESGVLDPSAGQTLARWDGSTWALIELDALLGADSTGDGGGGYEWAIAQDGSIWFVAFPPTSPDQPPCPDSTTCRAWAGGLYVVTPQALAIAE